MFECFYIINMFENLTKEEYLIMCDDLSQYSYDELLALSKRVHELWPINEMAYNRGQFIGLCGSLSEQITYNLLYIIILGDYEMFYSYINHWKTELMSYINKLFKRDVERSVKKDKIVYDFIIDTYVDPETLEFDNVEVASEALEKEIKKGQNNKKYKAETNFIKTQILPNIEYELYKHSTTFHDLYIALINSFKQKDISIFEKQLNTI